MPSVFFSLPLEYIARRAEELGEVLKANGWKYNEWLKFYSSHDVTVGLEKEPKLSAKIIAEVSEKKWKFFSLGSYPLSNWRNSYIAYKKQVVSADHLINLVRVLYERFSAKKMAEIITAVCGEERPVFAFIPYKGSHAKFLIAPHPAERINPEDMVYDIGRDRFVKWKEYRKMEI